ncbi:MAG: c-type cytochrome [Candidatus Eremiobacteraeota bacterium]|nr:c-type cytochrome [Candidatus Eremiobacteraeota bacterium]MBC5803727.1 c-type cytochrome [Candidatus Eremiobacteraeota bacterium]MBC5822436.1 c-type cytochrome [Candidatus Eremiobacteraeota bacterium]
MRNVRGFINGIVFTVALLIAAGFVAIYEGVLPAGAENKPSKIEAWIARTSLHATITRDTKNLTNPLQPTDDNLAAGVKLYGENCAVCHGASDGKPSDIAQGLNIKAPQLATDGVEDDPESVTYWKIAHGIRFSAMPSFKKTLTDDDLWRVTMFLKHMDKLPPAIDAQWKKLPSAASQLQ